MPARQQRGGAKITAYPHSRSMRRGRKCRKWKLGTHRASPSTRRTMSGCCTVHVRSSPSKPLAAPPVVVFDAAGNFVKARGGAGSGYDWPRTRARHPHRPQGLRWIGGNNCPTSGSPGLPVADDALLKFTPDGACDANGRSNQSGDATRPTHRAADAWVHPATNECS